MRQVGTSFIPKKICAKDVQYNERTIVLCLVLKKLKLLKLSFSCTLRPSSFDLFDAQVTFIDLYRFIISLFNKNGNHRHVGLSQTPAGKQVC